MGLVSIIVQSVFPQFASFVNTMDPKENRGFIKFHNFITDPKKIVKLIVLSICTIVVIFQVNKLITFIPDGRNNQICFNEQLFDLTIIILATRMFSEIASSTNYNVFKLSFESNRFLPGDYILPWTILQSVYFGCKFFIAFYPFASINSDDNFIVFRNTVWPIILAWLLVGDIFHSIRSALRKYFMPQRTTKKIILVNMVLAVIRTVSTTSK